MRFEVAYNSKAKYPLRVRVSQTEWYWVRNGLRLRYYRTVIR